MQGGIGVLDRLSRGEAGGSVRAECGAVGSMVGNLTFNVNVVKENNEGIRVVCRPLTERTAVK